MTLSVAACTGGSKCLEWKYWRMRAGCSESKFGGYALRICHLGLEGLRCYLEGFAESRMFAKEIANNERWEEGTVILQWAS